MLNGLSKALVLVAVLGALAYGFHRFQSCRIVGVNAAKLPSSLATTPRKANEPIVTSSQAEPDLIYPSRTALGSLGLGYEVLRIDSDSSVMALPLPPGLALQTTFILSPSGHHSLSISGIDNRCTARINVNFYQVNQENPVYAGQISPASKAAPLFIDLKKTGFNKPFIVTIKLAHGSQNNWFCNLAFLWDSAK